MYNLDDPTKHAIYKSYQSYYYYDEPETNNSPPEIPPKPKKASPENIQKAKEIIQQLNASGGQKTSYLGIKFHSLKILINFSFRYQYT